MPVVMYRWWDVRLSVWWNGLMYICTDRQVDKAILTPLRRLRTLALHAGAGSTGGGEIG